MSKHRSARIFVKLRTLTKIPLSSAEYVWEDSKCLNLK